MLVYSIIFCLLFAGTVVDLCDSKYKKLIFQFNFFLIFCVVTFRYGVGVDYFPYVELFKLSKDITQIDLSYFYDNPHQLEFGYLLFESIVKLFTDDYFYFSVFYFFASL